MTETTTRDRFWFCQRAIEHAGLTELSADIRLNPDDVADMRRAHQTGAPDRRVTWDGPDPEVGTIRFLGYRVLPSQFVVPGTAMVLCKPCE